MALLFVSSGDSQTHVVEDSSGRLEARRHERSQRDLAQATSAVELYLTGLQTRHAAPGALEGQAGEPETPEDGQGNGEQERRGAVTPVLGQGVRLKLKEKCLINAYVG